MRKRNLIRKKNISIMDICNGHLKIYEQLEKKIRAFISLDRNILFRSTKILDDQIQKGLEFKDTMLGSLEELKMLLILQITKQKWVVKYGKIFMLGMMLDVYLT